ncbi:MAG: putative cupin superfamily sugar epimerase [Myxococcota bacterium]|jgi:predicted cupin superfamily sugar epimerase
MALDIDSVIRHLVLVPHPEGGHYRETFRSEDTVGTQRGQRSAGTAIFFALRDGEYSAWHRVRADEVWHHYDGAPAEVHVLHKGVYLVLHLGSDLSKGQRPQAVVPAGAWQAAHAKEGGALLGCTVAPGFEFDDFELADSELIEEYPEHSATIAWYLK